MVCDDFNASVGGADTFLDEIQNATSIAMLRPWFESRFLSSLTACRHTAVSVGCGLADGFNSVSWDGADSVNSDTVFIRRRVMSPCPHR